MYNNTLKQALHETLTPQYSSMLDINKDLLSYKFSKSYIKKRNKIIKLRSHSYYKLVSTVGRRIACVIIAFFIAAFTTIFSVEALRTAFLDFIMNIFPTHTVFQSADTTEAPETIEDIYIITYDLSDFEIGFEHYDELMRIIEYMDFEKQIMISFAQYVKSEWNPHINTENTTLEEFKLEEQEGIYFLDNNSYNVYIWENEEYVFHIYGNVDKYEMDLIVLSVKIVE